MLGPHFVGGHGVWITNEDIRQLADTGSMVAHLPASNLKLGSGIAPVSEMLDHGVTVGLGTDGSMSSDNQNMFEAMRFAALVSRVRFPHHPERWVGAQSAWNMATTGSARVLGLENDVEKIEPGYKADLVLLRADSIFLRPLNNAINALVYAETGASVATVIIDGRVVLENGRVLRVNEQQLLHRAQETAGRLREHNTAAWAFAEQLTPYIKMSYQAIIAKPYPINRYAAPVGMNCDSNRKR
jgi:cytosine/adenosine deaminase-related metal-dependent hydrolase